MKILRLYIENFGKLSNFALELDKDFVAIREDNGWGKTTLSIFLKAMFYSMPQKGNNKPYKAERSKYKPWQGGVYGGWIEFESKKGSYRITRTFADTPEGDTFSLVNLKTGLESKDYSKDIGLELFCCGVETFMVTAFFPQMSLASGLTDEMRANMSGLGKFENDLGALKDAEKSIANKAKSVRGDRPKQADIDDQKSAKMQVERLIQSTKDDIESLKEKIERKEKELKEAKAFQNQFEKNSAIHKEKLQNIEKANKYRLSLQEKLSLLLSQKLEEKPQEDKKNRPSLVFGIAISVVIFALSLVLGGINILSWAVAGIFAVAGLIACAICVLLLTKNKPKPQQKQENNSEVEALREEIKRQEEIVRKYSEQEDDFDENSSKLQEIYALEKDVAIDKNDLKNLINQNEEACERVAYLDREITSREQLLQDCKRKLVLLEKTLEFLSKAKENVSARYVEPMKKAFDQILERVDAKEKEKLSLNVNFEVSEISPTGNKEIEYLSQGYRDLLSIVQRLALLDDVYKDEKPFVLLDDPCVNLDDKKATLLKEVIKEFSKRYQLIYLYCHTRNEM